MNLKLYLGDRRGLVEAALDRYLPPETQRPQSLHQAIRYSVLAPGKRIRPILVIASAEAVGGAGEDVLPTACALECIHAFSLVHDDLPCMDNDDYRRGRPTSHKVYGEALAMLAGDALLALAFELIAENARTAPVERIVPVLRLVAHATGTAGMVGGQVVDIESEGKEIGYEDLQFIHEHKTGALLTASVLSGAMLCGANQQQIEALSSYGRSVGLAFQIADDILDITGDEAKIGKPVGSDLKQDKATYPKLFGLDGSRERARLEVRHALDALAGFDARADPLRAIAQYIVERDL
ncbi:MAG: polyprenyl synthetase family protein [Chthonomonadales bacterium]